MRTKSFHSKLSRAGKSNLIKRSLHLAYHRTLPVYRISCYQTSSLLWKSLSDECGRAREGKFEHSRRGGLAGKSLAYVVTRARETQRERERDEWENRCCQRLREQETRNEIGMIVFCYPPPGVEISIKSRSPQPHWGLVSRGQTLTESQTF